MICETWSEHISKGWVYVKSSKIEYNTNHIGNWRFMQNSQRREFIREHNFKSVIVWLVFTENQLAMFSNFNIFHVQRWLSVMCLLHVLKALCKRVQCHKTNWNEMFIRWIRVLAIPKHSLICFTCFQILLIRVLNLWLCRQLDSRVCNWQLNYWNAASDICHGSKNI